MSGRLETLKRLAGTVAKTRAIVELGAYTGKSTLALAHGSRAATVYAVDLWDIRLPDESGRRNKNPYPLNFESTATFKAFLRNLDKSEAGRQVIWIKGDSGEIAKAWTRSIGLLHIDAAHDYASVLRDYEGWAPHIVKGGWLCMDDAQHPQKVGKVIDEVIKPSDLWGEWELVAGRMMVARRK